MNRRLGAGSYLLCMSLSVITWSLLTGLACIEFAQKGRIGTAELNFFVSLTGIALGVVFYGTSARRLRDLNFPAWSAKVLSFPLFGVIVLPVLCFVSGPRWENDFGPPPPRSGFLKVASAFVLFFAAIPASHWALVTYFQTRHALLG
jgi:uncharacterized membrane protein YhaH (DUF805 family)